MSSSRRGRMRQSVRRSVGVPIYRGQQSWPGDPRVAAIDIDPYYDGQPRKQQKFKNCCRSVATFMCTQVGVGGIIVGYAIVGAFAFIALETQEGNICDFTVADVNQTRYKIAKSLYEDYSNNMFNEVEWRMAANTTLFEFQQKIVKSVKENGFDGRNSHEQWNFPAALMFTLSIFTMIGFGNLVPRTNIGKLITICYAVVGIPLYVLYFMNMGRALANAFKFIYVKLNSCSIGRKSNPDFSNDEIGSNNPNDYRLRKDEAVDETDTSSVPSSASIYVLISYIAVGTIMFAEWESWDYLDSVYFCVTSLCKIGLGDFVPGTNLDDSLEGNQTKLVINFIYLLLGLGLVAMCYNLLKEEVLAKVKQLKNDFRDLCYFIKNDCTNCCN